MNTPCQRCRQKCANDKSYQGCNFRAPNGKKCNHCARDGIKVCTWGSKSAGLLAPPAGGTIKAGRIEKASKKQGLGTVQISLSEYERLKGIEQQFLGIKRGHAAGGQGQGAERSMGIMDGGFSGQAVAVQSYHSPANFVGLQEQHAQHDRPLHVGGGLQHGAHGPHAYTPAMQAMPPALSPLQQRPFPLHASERSQQPAKRTERLRLKPMPLHEQLRTESDHAPQGFGTYDHSPGYGRQGMACTAPHPSDPPSEHLYRRDSGRASPNDTTYTAMAAARPLQRAWGTR